MSEKTLGEKLLIKPGYKIWLIHQPEGYLSSLGKLPDGASLVEDPAEPVDFIQIFAEDQKDLEAHLGGLKSRLKPKGLLWISYHKGTSRVKTNINRDTIWAYSKEFGLEAVFLISINDDWSAMRLKVKEAA